MHSHQGERPPEVLDQYQQLLASGRKSPVNTFCKFASKIEKKSLKIENDNFLQFFDKPFI